jgi:hypothetical protein
MFIKSGGKSGFLDLGQERSIPDDEDGCAHIRVYRYLAARMRESDSGAMPRKEASMY